MELDTGSVVSDVSKEVCQEYLHHVPLKDTFLKLHTYTGEPVEPMGFCNVTVLYEGQSKELPIYVMPFQQRMVRVHSAGLAFASVRNIRRRASPGRSFE